VGVGVVVPVLVTPVPLIAMVLVPFVWSAVTVSVPLNVPVLVGEKRMITGMLLPAGTVPLVVEATNNGANPPETAMLEKDKIAFPLFEIVSVESLLAPTVTLPKARSPERAMTRVGETDEALVGVEIPALSLLQLDAINANTHMRKVL
jgi:hypothetical protein